MSADKKQIFLTRWRQLAPGLPEPQPEVRFHAERKWRIDWGWPDYLVGVEIDGGRWSPMGGRHAGDDDKEKRNAAVEYGWRVLHYSPAMLENNPHEVIRQVAAVLTQEILSGHGAC